MPPPAYELSLAAHNQAKEVKEDVDGDDDDGGDDDHDEEHNPVEQTEPVNDLQ